MVSRQVSYFCEDCREKHRISCISVNPGAWLGFLLHRVVPRAPLPHWSLRILYNTFTYQGHCINQLELQEKLLFKMHQ